MKPIKINITPEVREFNEAVEACDIMTDFLYDTIRAERLLIAVQNDGHLPAHAEWLANAIAGLAIKRRATKSSYSKEYQEAIEMMRPSCDCGNVEASWHGPVCGLRQYMCESCWSELPQDKRQ